MSTDLVTPPYMDVSKTRGGPPKWMVKIMMENLIEMDDLGGNTLIIGNTHIQKFKEANHQLESHDEVPNV